MDWNLCVLCQQDGDDLKVPSANLDPNVCGYSSLARNINSFLNEGLQLPNKITVALSDLIGDSNIADNLRAHKAKWHKGCQAELAPCKLERILKSAANKRHKKSSSMDVPSKRTRSSLDTQTQPQSS